MFMQRSLNKPRGNGATRLPRRRYDGTISRALCAVVVAFFAFGVAAARAAKPATKGRTIIERVTYNGWAGAWRLTNGVAEVVVVPEVARVMRYGYVDGPNVLWDNPTTFGKPVKIGEWPNIGGEKAWPWPQNDWPKYQGAGWPPPPGSDQTPYQAEAVGGDTLRITSPPVIGFGFRIVRDITLAPQGTRVTVRTQFQKYGGGLDLPVAAWTILQARIPDGPVLARVVSGSTLANAFRTDIAPFWNNGTVAPIGKGGATLAVTRPLANNGKVFLDADLLAARYSDTLLTVRADLPGVPASAFQPGDRAQVYSNPENADDLKRGIQPYVELELTGPLTRLAKGESLSLTTVWELRRLGENERTPEAMATLIQK